MTRTHMNTEEREAMRLRSVRIRMPEKGEMPLSQEERRVAMRECVDAIEEPKWHPAIARNFSLMSARLNRKAVAA